MRESYIHRWYVLHTKSRFENVVNDGLSRKSLEVFLPRIKVKSRRKDRRMMIETPLFSGYLFVKSNLMPDEHIEILKTPGVVRIIGNRGGPLPVQDETIESLKIIIQSGEDIMTGARFKKGDRVMVVDGPFAGVRGIFVRYRGQERVVVNIEALGQFASVNASEDDIEILPEILT